VASYSSFLAFLYNYNYGTSITSSTSKKGIVGFVTVLIKLEERAKEVIATNGNSVLLSKLVGSKNSLTPSQILPGLVVRP